MYTRGVITLRRTNSFAFHLIEAKTKNIVRLEIGDRPQKALDSHLSRVKITVIVQ